MSIAEKIKTVSDNVEKVYSSGGYVGSQQGMKFQESEDSKKIHQELQRQAQIYNTQPFSNEGFNTNLKNLTNNVDSIAADKYNSGFHQGVTQQSYNDYLKTTEVIEWQLDAYGYEELQEPKETFEENIEVIKDNTSALFIRGREDGEEYGKEVGKEEVWNSFWDKFQGNGTRTNYSYAFCTWGTIDDNAGWDETNFKPKHSFSNIKQAEFMFRLSSLRGSLIDILAERNLEFNTANCTTFNYMFGYAPNITEIPMIDLTKYNAGHYVFYGCKALKKLSIFSKDTITFTNYSNSSPNSWFYNCSSLTDLEVSGVIGGNIDLKFSPLTKDSILSVFDALSTEATGKIITFNEAAVNAAFTPEEWEALTDTKPNWTYVLA